MNTLDGAIRRLQELKITMNLPGDTPLVIDTGLHLTTVDDIDLGASDEGVIIVMRINGAADEQLSRGAGCLSLSVGLTPRRRVNANVP